MMRTLSIRSFIRLRQRRSVDLPQPEGPMNAVTCLAGMSIVMSKSAWLSPSREVARRECTIAAAQRPASGRGNVHTGRRAVADGRQSPSLLWSGRAMD